MTDKTRREFGPVLQRIVPARGRLYRRMMIEELTATATFTQYDPRHGAIEVREYEETLRRAISTEEEDRDF